ncbi:hypothetical protein BRADI_1g29826v3 [Brachypodium distachyon]|uniref:C2H2-type domain-containing protein n=1 Tax=Brachypodium distachyon TaxID=15368 RepID=A0A0Q3H0Y5_BRADI|nr:hypothetical protein BRADI_1g29826v3 [Brachypodium distachyon]
MAASSFFLLGRRLAVSSFVSGAGGGGGDEPPRYNPWRLKSAHELDDGGSLARPSSLECGICGRALRTASALRAHMLRCHADVDPAAPPPVRPFVCGRCGRRFLTWWALGGHRSSHNGRKGCSRLSKQQHAQAMAARAPKPAVVRDFDLNEPPAPETEEEENEDPVAPAAK